MTPDKNVEAVRAKLLERSQVGLAKYGVTTERTDTDLVGWLNHLQEELMDAAVYVQRSMVEIEAQEPVAVIGNDYQLLYVGSGPLAPLVLKHGLKVGSKLFAAPVVSQQEQPRPLPFAILPNEMADLQRFHECAMDDEGYDVPKERMKRLAEIGLVRRVSANYYEHTTFGQSVLNGDFSAPVVSPDVERLMAEIEKWKTLAKRCGDWGEERRQAALDASEMAMQRKDENQSLKTELEAARKDVSRFKGVADMWLVETVNERTEHADARKLTQKAFKESAAIKQEKGGA